MSHPNRSHPEPMRIWPINANKARGDMFLNSVPSLQDWKIESQKSYELNYRMLVFDGKITPQEVEQHWKAFAFQPLINFKIIKQMKRKFIGKTGLGTFAGVGFLQ